MRELDRTLRIIAVLLTLVSSTKTYGAQGFAPAKNYPVSINPKAVVVADFNGDGKLDIVVPNSGDPSTADGTFQRAHDMAAGKNPWSIDVGDFNRDGHLDLVIPNNSIDAAGGWHHPIFSNRCDSN